MRRLLLGLLALAASASGVFADASTDAIRNTFSMFVNGGNPAVLGPAIMQIGGGLFGGGGNVAQVIQVSKGGSGKHVICGANCAVETSACVPGSALASITDSSITKPYAIVVNPGVYDECVSFDSITDISLVGVDRDSVIIRPTVGLNSAAVSGGVIRFGKVTATAGATNRGLTARIEVSNLTAWNDAFSAPESAIMAGIDAGPGAGNSSPWTDIYIHNVRAIGAHDGIQWFGSRLTPDLALPRITVENNLVIVGADGITAKGWAISKVSNNVVTVQSNWCESTDTANLAVETGLVACDTACGTGQFNIPAGSVSTGDGFYVGRKVAFSGGAPCPVNGEVDWVSAYAGSTRRITVLNGLSAIPDTDCTYTIEAVKHNNGTDYVAGDAQDSPCLDADWNAYTTLSTYWKSTCFHFGIGNATTSVPIDELTVVNGLICDIIVNDRGAAGVAGGSTSCATQQSTTPVLFYSSTHRDVQISNVTSHVVLNTDQNDTALCDSRVAAVAFTGIGVVEGTLNVSDINHYMLNRADTDTPSLCVASSSTATAAGEMRASNIYCDINNTVGSYTGTKAHIFRNDTGISTLVAHDIGADELVKSSGTFAGWPEACVYVDAGLDSVIGALTDLPIPITSSEQGVQIGYIGCRCYGTCANAEAVTLEDENNNAIGSATCVDNTTAVLTWTDVRADADSDVIGGCTPPNTCAVSPRLTVTQRGSAVGDDLMFCVRFNTTRL